MSESSSCSRVLAAFLSPISQGLAFSGCSNNMFLFLPSRQPVQEEPSPLPPHPSSLSSAPTIKGQGSRTPWPGRPCGMGPLGALVLTRALRYGAPGGCRALVSTRGWALLHNVCPSQEAKGPGPCQLKGHT